MDKLIRATFYLEEKRGPKTNNDFVFFLLNNNDFV